LALAEMYVQGVSTRKVIEVLQKLVGPDFSISSTQISRCAEKLDAGLEAWRNRPLDETPYVLLDARYERVREAGQVMDCAVLVAVGVTASGHRRVLGVSVALSEAEVHWRKEHPKLAAWAEENLTEGFAVFALPPEHRVRMRTTNGVERLNKEIKRRTRVATLFPNSASCLRLVSAILAEQDEEWLTAKIYLTMNP
jgi:transposase-like protein